MIFLVIVVLLELHRNISKMFTGRSFTSTLLSVYNLYEMPIICGTIGCTIVFLVVGPENFEDGAHFLGWALYLGWTTLSVLLAPSSHAIGQTIYMSLHILSLIHI